MISTLTKNCTYGIGFESQEQFLDLMFKYPTKHNLTDLDFMNWNRTNKYHCICYHGEFQIFKWNPDIKAYNLQPIYKNYDKTATIGFFTSLLLSSRPKES